MFFHKNGYQIQQNFYLLQKAGRDAIAAISQKKDGLKISERDGEVCLKVDVRKNKDAAQLHEMLCSWQQAAAMLEAGEISKEDYDKWRYHYPEFDKAQNYVKVPPQDLF